MTQLPSALPVTFVLTADPEVTRPFYRDVLELPLQSEDPFGTTFALAGGAIMRLTTLPGHVPQVHTVLGWSVPDIRAAIAGLKGKGVEFQIFDGFGQDEDGVWQTPDGSTKVAWFADPEGNGLSLSQFG